MRLMVVSSDTGPLSGDLPVIDVRNG